MPKARFVASQESIISLACTVPSQAALCSALLHSSALWSDPSRSARKSFRYRPRGSFRYRPRTHRTRQPRSRSRRCCAELRRASLDRFRHAHPDTPFRVAPVSDRAAVTSARTGHCSPLRSSPNRGCEHWSALCLLRRRHDGRPPAPVNRPSSAVALDGALHSAQRLVQIVGIHHRRHLDLGVQPEEEALGDFRYLR
jgi:hypothetical protein